MPKVFGGEASLMGQVAYWSGQDGYGQVHWTRFCAEPELRQQILQVLDGQAKVVPMDTVVMIRRKPSPKQKIIHFYDEVFGLRKAAAAAVKGRPLFKKDGRRDRFDLILSARLLSDNDILAALAKWQPGVIDRSHIIYGKIEDIKALPEGHTRPNGSYVIRHVGAVQSDQEHHGKSYHDAVAEGLTFLTYREYLIATLRNLWEKGEMFDQNGWTVTCSLWPNGTVVTSYGMGPVLALRSKTFNEGGCPDTGPRSVEIL